MVDVSFVRRQTLEDKGDVLSFMVAQCLAKKTGPQLVPIV